MRLAAGLCPDPLGERLSSPRPPSRKKGLLLRGGDGREREGREEEGKGGEEKGEWRGGKGEGKGPSWLVANEAFFLKSASGRRQLELDGYTVKKLIISL